MLGLNNFIQSTDAAVCGWYQQILLEFNTRTGYEHVTYYINNKKTFELQSYNTDEEFFKIISHADKSKMCIRCQYRAMSITVLNGQNSKRLWFDFSHRYFWGERLNYSLGARYPMRIVGLLVALFDFRRTARIQLNITDNNKNYEYLVHLPSRIKYVYQPGMIIKFRSKKIIRLLHDETRYFKDIIYLKPELKRKIYNF